MPLELIIIILSPFLALAVLALLVYGVAWWINHDHRENLAYRRREMGHVYVTNKRDFPAMAEGSPVELVVGEVVLGCNAITMIFSRLKMLFGGEVHGFHDVVTRARQEVVLRVMEAAAAKGYDSVCNLRLEAVDISGQTTATGKQKNRGLFVGVIAYAVAYRRVPDMYPPPAPPTLEGYLQ